MAVVAESPDDVSVEFRTYCSQWPVDGRRHVRAPILEPGPAHPGDVVGRYQAALDAGDVDAIVGTFATAGYLREPIGPDALHRGVTRAAVVLRRVLRRGRWHRTPALRADRRRRAVRARVQLRPLGRPRAPAAGRHRGVRAGAGRAAGRGAGLRRRRSRRVVGVVSTRRMSSQRDRRLRAAVGSAQCARWCTGTGRSTGCASRGSTARRSSPACSATQAGHWSVRVPGTPSRSTRRYVDRTMVLETTYRTTTGTAVVVDALAMGEGNRGHDLGEDAPHLLLRQVTCTAGEVEIELEYVPRPEYGLVVPVLDAVDGGLRRHGRRRRPRPVVPGAGDRRRFVGVGPVPSSARASRRASRCITAARRRPGGPGVERVRDRDAAGRHGGGVAVVVGPAPGVRRTVARSGPPQRTGAPGAVVPTDRRDLRGGDHVAAGGRRRRHGTGTTATPGSATRRSRSRRSGWRRARTRRTSSSSP